MSDTELDRFKTEINLSAYAAAQGYVLLKKESSRNSVAMKHSNGDKIIIARGPDQHWVYFSLRDERDHGSIIDFVQQRQGGSLGHVRKRLREWTGGQAPCPAPELFATEVRPSTPDRQAVIAAWARMRPVEEHPYLKSRGLGKEITDHPRFVGTLKMDQRGNAVFPHYDQEGLCGYEIKNRAFTGFSPGGEKSLWLSQCFAGDDTLVITESAIDALSFHGLQGWPHARYLSTAGAWSKQVVGLMQKTVQEFPGSRIVLAFDHDDSGMVYETKAREFLAGSEKEIETLFPDHSGEDWNDQLRRQTFPSPSCTSQLS